MASRRTAKNPDSGSLTRALRERIAGRSVECAERDRDRYGRIVAVCRVGGADLNAWMVEQGWAVAYRKYRGNSNESTMELASGPANTQFAAVRIAAEASR